MEDAEKAELALSAELNSMVKGRKTAREVMSWLEESVLPVHGLDITLRVVVQTLLEIGSKSFTHLITVLERYGQVIAKICPDQEKQIMLIDEVSSFWKNSSQTTAITIDRMMGYRLISNLAIVRWVFTPGNIEQFHTSDRLWEVHTFSFSRVLSYPVLLLEEYLPGNKNKVYVRIILVKGDMYLQYKKHRDLTLVSNSQPLD